MRRYLSVLTLVALTNCTAAVNVEDERNALMERDRAWGQTTTDTDRFLSFVAADATMYPPGMAAVSGLESIRQAWSEMSAAPGFQLSFAPNEARVAASGDIGYTTGTYDMRSAAGAERGKYVTVWQKEGDEWKVVEDIFNADAAPQAASQHVMMAPGDLKWGDPPPSLPPGARLAVVSGDPSQAAPFVIRAQVPAGYRVAPHWHPGVENLTVLSGTVAIGMGEQFDQNAMTAMGPGGYVSLPAEMRHYFMSKTASTFQVEGMGPFVVNYVNSADDPSAQK